MPTLTGTPGNDLLAGDDGDDVLSGLGGNDVIAGGRGADILDGGDGDDLISIAQALAANTTYGRITGGAGYDILDLSGIPGARLEVVNSAESLSVINGQRVYILGIEEIRGGAGADVLLIRGVNGTGPADGATLRGGFGEDGNDQLSSTHSATFGHDILDGGAGGDRLRGGLGDAYFGGDGDDIVNVVRVENLAGGSDVIDGGAGTDLIWAFGFEGGVIDLASGTSTLGSRTVSLTGFENAQVAVKTGFTFILRGTEGDNTLFVTPDPDNLGAAVLEGRGGNDTLLGSFPTNDVFWGGDGDDILYGGGGGEDVLDGGAGSDQAVFFAARSAYLVTTTNGVTTVSRAGETARLTGVEALRFSDGLVGIDGQAVTTITGTSASETLYGSAQGDTITGLGGGDVIYTGTGADIIRYRQASDSGTGFGQQDTLMDFQSGSDVIDLSAVNPTSVTIIRTTSQISAQVYVDTAAGPMILLFSGGAPQGGDIVTGNAIGITMLGHGFGVTLTGSARPDGIFGGGQNDIITGGGGADALSGGLGADVFNYTSVTDSNAAGADILVDFATGTDRIDITALSATSVSIVRAADGSSFVFAETGSGGFLTTAAARTIQGSDIVYNGTFGVFISGSSVSDALIGSSRGEGIIGGGGDDIITGGGGADALFGDAGADTFVYAVATDSSVSAADTIFGFVSGVDRLDLTALRTSSSARFDIVYQGGSSFVFVDLTNDGRAEVLVQVAGTLITAADIRWTLGSALVEDEAKSGWAENAPESPAMSLADHDAQDPWHPVAASDGWF